MKKYISSLLFCGVLIAALICVILNSGSVVPDNTVIQTFDEETMYLQYDTSQTNDTTSTSLNKQETQTDSSKKIIAVPNICQYPELPTGCEATCAVMVLRYYGVDTTPSDFAAHRLECSGDFREVGGILYGPDPDKVFVGSPFSESSYGCYAQPIANAINRGFTQCSAEKITGMTLSELCRLCIDSDKPLLIWATMEMRESQKGNTWTLNDGSEFTWIAGEHCLVLVGYDENSYYMNDPRSGDTVPYPKEIAEKRFAELGMQAVLIQRK